MSAHKRKRHAHRRIAADNTDRLKSIQRDDGLWESIEHDDETVLGSGCDNDAEPLPIKQHQPPIRSVTPRGIQLNSIGTQTLPTDQALPDTPAKQLLPRPDPPSPPSAPVATLDHPPVRRRRPGRPPKKKTNEPSVHRRHVRFTDPPNPSDVGPSRACHLFVRLQRVLVQLGVDGRQQVEFVWNNRAKAWKLSGDRGSEGMVELHGLLEQPPDCLSILHPFVVPTENGGVRQLLEMAWDPETFCFRGINQDNEAISITLGEMKDMARDPWKRQYVGYIVG